MQSSPYWNAFIGTHITSIFLLVRSDCNSNSECVHRISFYFCFIIVRRNASEISYKLNLSNGQSTVCLCTEAFARDKIFSLLLFPCVNSSWNFSLLVCFKLLEAIDSKAKITSHKHSVYNMTMWKVLRRRKQQRTSTFKMFRWAFVHFREGLTWMLGKTVSLEIWNRCEN